jgi:hypothetical protein
MAYDRLLCPMQWQLADQWGQLEVTLAIAKQIYGDKKRCTCNHFPGVIDNTLVILVGPMGEIHADYAYSVKDSIQQ